MEPRRVFPLLEPPHACPACGAPGPRPLHVFRVKHNKRRVTPQLHLALIGCETCGVVHSSPLPTVEELDAYYAAEGAGWDARIPTDEAVVADALAKRRDVHRVHLALVERHVDGLRSADGARPRALDLGCGIGGWLEALADAGWETFGIEPGPRAAEIAARRHTILADVPADGDFELVVVHHTLEHLPDPAETLGRLAGALRVGGAIWISVPNLETLPEHRDFVYVAGDKHLFSYTSAALRSLLGAVGVELVASSTDGSWPSVPRERLAVIGRKVGVTLPPPAEPLRPAVEALAAYARTFPLPLPPGPPPPRWRRVARRLLC